MRRGFDGMGGCARYGKKKGAGNGFVENFIMRTARNFCFYRLPPVRVRATFCVLLVPAFCAGSGGKLLQDEYLCGYLPPNTVLCRGHLDP
jgi:hypothetical protein